MQAVLGSVSPGAVGRVLAIAVIAILAFQYIVRPGPAAAHSEGTEIASEAKGPFVIGFRILPLQPLVGKLHVTITVDSLATGEPVNHARVRITARRAGGGSEAQFSPGLAIPTEPRFYDANFEIDKGGRWTFDVEVSSPAGSVDVQVPVLVAERVRGAGLGIAGTVMFIIVTLALVGIAGWVTLTARRNQRARRESRAGRNS